MYDKTGNNHLGAFDLKTGLQLKNPIPKRKTNKIVSLPEDESPFIKVLERILNKVLRIPPLLLPPESYNNKWSPQMG
jgi:Cytotoxic